MATTLISESCKAQAEALKGEGNALFAKQHFRKAYKKYTSAINLDDRNAVLYANRSACSLSLKAYLDAASDAKEAVKIDPAYPKAWARLAKASHALGTLDESVSAYQKALSCIPANPSLGDQALKKQCEDGLADIEEKKTELANPKPKDSIQRQSASQVKQSELPWNRAIAIESEIVTTRKLETSAWVIMTAHRYVYFTNAPGAQPTLLKEFMSGLKTMMRADVEDIGGGRVNYHAGGIAFSDMMNGILRDPRAFHINPAEFFERYPQQAQYENTSRNAWFDVGVSTVKKEARQRLKKSGWDDVRPALRSTVTGWFMKAFIYGSTNQFTPSVAFYSQTVDILEWGRQTFKEVSTDERGPIFKSTYVRGVKRLYMNTVLQAHRKHQSDFKIDDAVNLAHQIIADVAQNPPSPNEQYDPGFVLSFWKYTISDAHAVLGYYYKALGLQAVPDSQEAREHFQDAARQYVSSANALPVDDECHAYFLAIAVEAYWRRGSSLSVTLAACRRIQDSIEKARYLWGSRGKGSSPEVRMCMAFHEEWEKRVLGGEVSLDFVAKPEEIP